MTEGQTTRRRRPKRGDVITLGQQRGLLSPRARLVFFVVGLVLGVAALLIALVSSDRRLLGSSLVLVVSMLIGLALRLYRLRHPLEGRELVFDGRLLAKMLAFIVGFALVVGGIGTYAVITSSGPGLVLGVAAVLCAVVLLVLGVRLVATYRRL